MSCLNASAYMVQGCLNATAVRLGALSVMCERRDAMSVSAQREGALTASTERWYGLASVSAQRKDALGVSVSLVCTASDAYYLRVTPEEPQWVTEWETAMYGVSSNTSWRVTETPTEQEVHNGFDYSFPIIFKQ